MSYTAYVCNNNDGTVSVINVSTGTVTSTITVGTAPRSVAVTPDGTKAFVGNYASNSVSVINTSTGAVTSTITVGTNPNCVAITPDGTKVYVGCGDGRVYIINATTGATITTITVSGSNPWAIAFTPDGTKAYVCNSGNSTVSVINVSTGTITSTITVGNAPLAIAITPDGTKAFVCNNSPNTISVISTSSDTVTSTISSLYNPSAIAISPDGTKAYVLNSYETVSVLNIPSGSVASTITVSSRTQCTSLVLSPDGTTAYVANGQNSGFHGGTAPDNTISVINTATGTITSTISTGSHPNGISLIGTSSTGGTPSAPSAPTFGASYVRQIEVTLPALPTGATSLNLYVAPDVSGAPGSFTLVSSGSGLAGGANYEFKLGSGLATVQKYWFACTATGTGGTSSQGTSAAASTTGCSITVTPTSTSVPVGGGTPINLTLTLQALNGYTGTVGLPGSLGGNIYPAAISYNGTVLTNGSQSYSVSVPSATPVTVAMALTLTGYSPFGVQSCQINPSVNDANSVAASSVGFAGAYAPFTLNVGPGDYLLTDSAAISSLSKLNVAYTSTIFSDSIIAGNRNGASRIFTDALFSDSLTRSSLSHPLQTFTDTLLAGSLGVGTLLRLRLFGDNLFLDSAVFGGVRRLNTVFSNAIFTDSATFGHLNAATRIFTDKLFTDFYSPMGVAHPAVSLSDTLFSDSGSRTAIAFTARAFLDSLFSDAGSRTGDPAHIGHTSPPFVFADGLFDDSETTSNLAGATRRLTDAGLFSDGFAVSTIQRALTAFTDTLFHDYAVFGTLIAPIDPSAVDENDPFVVAKLFLSLIASIQGYKMIATSKLLAILDKLAASYRTAESQATSTILTGLDALIIGQDGISGTTYGTGDETFILKTVAAADQMVTNSSPDVRNAAIYVPFMSTVNSYLAQVGQASGNYSNLDTYATYHNNLISNSFLVAPSGAYLQFLTFNKQSGLLMSPRNVFAPLTLFGQAVVGASAGTVAWTHLGSIPFANDTVSKLQGYTAAPGVAAQVSTAVNGTWTITVTANGQNAAGASVTGRTWTATLDNKAAGQVVAFTPSVAGDRIYDITAVTGTGTATAGAVNINSVLERIVS